MKAKFGAAGTSLTPPHWGEWIQQFVASNGEPKRKRKSKMPARLLEATYLACTRGTADKVYELFLERDGEDFIVRANYGRRGSVLKPTEKYRGDRQRATVVYGEVMREKIAKGYVEPPVHIDPFIGEVDNTGNIIEEDPAYYTDSEPAPKRKKAKSKKPVAAKKPTPPPPKIDRNITLGDL